MDKSLPSPTRENYEELDGLSVEEIEGRTLRATLTSMQEVTREVLTILEARLKK